MSSNIGNVSFLFTEIPFGQMENDRINQYHEMKIQNNELKWQQKCRCSLY